MVGGRVTLGCIIVFVVMHIVSIGVLHQPTIIKIKIEIINLSAKIKFPYNKSRAATLLVYDVKKLISKKLAILFVAQL